MNHADLSDSYQWNFRPQSPQRPKWFTSWPGGNRLAVTFNIMHEWESVPRSTTIRKRELTTCAAGIDFLALGARQYGANFGFQRLLSTCARADETPIRTNTSTIANGTRSSNTFCCGIAMLSRVV